MQEGKKQEPKHDDRYRTKGYHIRSTNYKIEIGDPPNDK